MDAINKLLGENGYVENVSTNHGDRVGKRASLIAGSNNKRLLGAAGNDVRKPVDPGVVQRSKKSFGKRGVSKLENSSPSQDDHPHIVDEANFTATITLGKSGGTFLLPLGASITIPENCFGKKDELSCRVATPQMRWQTFPTHLSSNEYVNSEIYTLSSPSHQLKKNVTICLPYIAVNSEFNEINVKVKYTGHIDWANVGFVVKELDNGSYAELDVNKLGTFLVTTTPKTETFEVTSQGCLYQARLSRHITVRFPKKAVLQDLQCSLQIIPIPAEKVHLSREQHVTDSTHITAVTEFIDLYANEDCHFARPVTIKLPLPLAGGQEVEGGGENSAPTQNHQDIAVLYKASTGWELVQTPYKFTRTTVCFDMKEMSRFCVTQCSPGKQKKMKDAITLLEGRSEREKGEICLFLSVKNKSWLGLVEVFPHHDSAARISGRVSDGFRLVSRTQTRQAEAASFRFSNRRHQPLTRSTPLVDGGDIFELHEGITWSINLDGDLKFVAQSDLRENTHLRYFARLKESFRTFEFEPLDMDPRPLEAYVNLVPLGLNDESLRSKLTFTFKIEVEESTMVEFLVPDSPRETAPEKIAGKHKELSFEQDHVQDEPREELRTPPPPTPKLKEMPSNVVRRLTHIKKPIAVSERESKALTGRSLMTLARLVPEGLTLAVHLELPDSTITGIGFDALSNNLAMSDVSYKILLYWKRKCKDKYMGAVQQLTTALREMNYHVIADAILKCHLDHKEFTRESMSLPQDEEFKSGTFL